jgi:hypothetical protein
LAVGRGLDFLAVSKGIRELSPETDNLIVLFGVGGEDGLTRIPQRRILRFGERL